MMYSSDFDDEVVHDKRVFCPQVEERLVVEVEEDVVASPGPFPMQGISFLNQSENLFANADKEPFTAAIFAAEVFRPTPLEPMEPYQGMVIKGRAQRWYRKQGLSVHSPVKQQAKKRSQTEKTHAKFAKWLSDYEDLVKKRDEMISKATRFHHDIVLEIVKYCQHLNEEPTTQRSFDSYQTRSADVVKSLLRNHSLIYPVVMKAVRKADPWSRSGPFDH
ncbi:hypothetical protein A0J61_11591 [Choanephora cucurbitarum]|uniref:Uncharacterized protein n=1 Tax=Choanephora cucurbitarum TaxID=101091 RepID=A0A1C7MU40_9FUNG|nr:hypothetical protein A0J61_11591 [Choanephora cucurbitarum]